MSRQAEENPGREDGPQRDEDPAFAGPRPPVFWQELYWFLLITVGGIALAIVVLAPRLAQQRSSSDVEASLRVTVAGIENLERQYDAAIEALETDPFYRDEVIRAVLQVKKNEEEFLGKDMPSSPVR